VREFRLKSGTSARPFGPSAGESGPGVARALLRSPSGHRCGPRHRGAIPPLLFSNLADHRKQGIKSLQCRGPQGK